MVVLATLVLTGIPACPHQRTMQASKMRIAPLAPSLAAALLLFGASHVDGAILASLQTEPLAPNSSGQLLNVFLRSDSGAITDVAGIQFHARIGDGTATQTGVPNFNIVDGATYSPGAADSFDLAFESGGTEASNPFRYSGGIVDLVTGGSTFTINTTETLVGSFRIDTTGISDQTFDFFIGDGGVGAQSFVESEGSGTISIEDFNGSFTVAAVPEPATISFLGVLTVGSFARMRRRRKGESAKLLTAAQ